MLPHPLSSGECIHGNVIKFSPVGYKLAAIVIE